MSDTPIIKSTDPVIIVGSTSSGDETTPVNSSLTGDLFTRDIINTSIISGAQSVGTSQVEAKVGSNKLANRKAVRIHPTNGTVYIGSSGVTTSSGSPVFKNQSVVISVSDIVSVFMIASSTVDVRIIEVS